MSAQNCIDGLDNALKAAGENIVLQRSIGDAPSATVYSANCRALVRSWRLHETELVGGIDQAMIIVTISPTDLARAQWGVNQAATAASPNPTDPQRGDFVIIAGVKRAIDAVEVMRVANKVVRYQMQALG